GDWGGVTIENVIDEGKIISKGTYDYFPSEKYIRGVHEANNEDGLVNRSVEYLYVDPYSEKFLKKSVFSYGFVNNEVSYHYDRNSIKFEMTMEPHPKQFEGMIWRSFITKISDIKIELGLERSTDGKDFELFNKSIWDKIS
ncbi:MAG: hypothetical protein ACW99Q_26935, partial [Candidatus Kariarchaeaceae archaeon]